MSTETAPTPDFTAIKVKQQATWATGNYAVVGSTLVLVAELLCEAMDLRSGSRVLDVAAGNGNATLAAARRWCQVTSTDYVPALLEQGKARAAADGFTVAFQEADAENLPFGDDEFDAVLSTFGVMFTPNQARSSAELFRVCRPGGKIGLANWTPASFVGQIFRTMGKYIPPPAGVSPPSLWGTEAHLHELFPTASNIQATELTCDFRYLSPDHWLEVFRTYYGPMNKAFAVLDEAAQTALTADLMALMASMNRATDGTLVLASEYLEVVITK
jgi:SAM-dependent methyltransferase